MRLSVLLKLIAVALLALGIALVAVVKSIDFNQYKGFLTHQVRAATGREMAIAGPLELKLGLVPTVTAEGITFANMPSGSRTEMATVERIEAEVALIPLLSRRLEVRRLLLVNPDLLLETDAKGRANWAITAPTEPAAVGSADGSPPTRIDAREVMVRNAVVTRRDGRTGKADRLGLGSLVLTPAAGSAGPLGIQAKGDVNGRNFELQGVVGALSAVASGKPWPVQIKGAVDGSVVVVDGTAADPLAGKGLDLKLSAQGEELANVLELAGIAIPPVGPYKASARLADATGGALALSELDLAVGKRDTAVVSAKGAVKDLAALVGIDLALTLESDNLAGLSRLAGTALPSLGPLKASGTLSGGRTALTLADIKAALGGSALGGELKLVLGTRPHLGGRLAATTLAATDFTTPAAKPGEKLSPKAPSAPSDGRVFSARPLPVEGLRSLDADVTLHVGRLVADGVTLTDVSAPLRLKGGKLSLAPVTALLGGGQVEAALGLDASGKTPAATASLGATRVDLGKVLKEGGTDLLSGGTMETKVALNGKGDSVRAIMAGLAGDAVITVGEGRIANKAVDWAGGDVGLQLLGAMNPLAKTDDHTELRCGVIHFAVKEGVAVADKGIALETAKANVVGAGAIDLRTEEIDIGITPRARDGVGLSVGGAVAGLTRVRGTLASPAIAIDELGAARTAASVGTAVATGGLSLLGELLFDKVTADDHPCRTALGRTAPARKKSGGSLIQGLFGR